MQRKILALALTSLAVASLAFAAPPERASASFQAFAASGITGDVDLMTMARGGTMVRGKISGLQEGTEYVLLVSDDATCSETLSSEDAEVVRFTANKSGTAHFNQKISVSLEDIGTLALRLRSNESLQGCAVVTTE